MSFGICSRCGRWFDTDESGKPDLCTDCVKTRKKIMNERLSSMTYAPKKQREEYAESIRKFCA